MITLLLTITLVATSPDREMTFTWPDGQRKIVAVKPRVAHDPLGDPCDHPHRSRWNFLGYPPVTPDVVIECRDAPGAFTPRENCIPGYRGPRREGRC